MGHAQDERGPVRINTPQLQ